MSDAASSAGSGCAGSDIYGKTLTTTDVLGVIERKGNGTIKSKSEFVALKPFLDDAKKKSGRGSADAKDSLLKLMELVVHMQFMRIETKAFLLCRVISYLDEFETRTSREWPLYMETAWTNAHTSALDSPKDRKDVKQAVADVETAI